MMYIQDEVTEQKVEKLQKTVDETYEALNLIHWQIIKEHIKAEQKLEAIEQKLEEIEKLLVCVANPENFVKPRSLEIGKEYIEEISFVGEEEEVLYQDMLFTRYRVKFEGFDEVFKLFIKSKYVVEVGTKIGFLLEEGNYLRKAKIYE